MYLTSYDLLMNGAFKDGTEYFDSLYLCAHVKEDPDDLYRFLIDIKTTPTVKMNQTIDLPVPTVAEMRVPNSLSLFSSNVMLEIEGVGYPVLRRDAAAQYDPLHYTCSAGRCDQSPLNTAIAELNEEIAIFVRNVKTSEIRLLGFSSDKPAQIGKLHKARLMKKTLPDLLVLPVSWRNGPHKYTLECGNFNSAWLNLSKQSSILEEGNALVYADAPTNTYEICFHASVSIPKDWVFHSIADGEGYGREAFIVQSLKDLDLQKCVPALQNFILFF